MAKDLLRKELSQPPCRDLYLAAMRRTTPDPTKGAKSSEDKVNVDSGNGKTTEVAAPPSASTSLEFGLDEAGARAQLLQASTDEKSWAHFCKL